MNILDRFERYLGHGRALETYLACLKILFGLILFPGWPINVAVLSDLQWFVPDIVIASPFLVVGVLQAIGLYLNAKGFEFSWIIRAAAATIAIFMWSWLLTKSILIGQLFTTITPLCVLGVPASGYILRKAIRRLPIPGAAGVV